LLLSLWLRGRLAHGSRVVDVR
ncbi:MAG: hypothetical protein QOG10_3837, partial [Kribbellaceae bacterium]|nr:hypothetical protein [Kribbellaceae bacterium]